MSDELFTYKFWGTVEGSDRRELFGIINAKGMGEAVLASRTIFRVPHREYYRIEIERTGPAFKVDPPL